MMKKRKKNLKGFTLAEEVITVILIGILIVTATGILMSAIRIFSQNVISLNAQARGIAVMDQLTDNLTYAKKLETVNSISAFSTDAANPCSYEMILYPETTGDNNSLSSNVRLKYVSGNTWQTPVQNKLCQLNSYEVEYNIEANGSFAVIKLEVKRHGKTWYTEHRTIELKNDPLNGSTFTYTSTGGEYLYIGSLE